MLARLKFEIKPLVKEILNQVDPGVFESSETTFLDPAMGGGQFIFETIRRLKEQGHSYNSIKSRVFGYESNILYVNYVKERYFREFGEEIPASLLVGGLKELESLKMRFDLVMSNPPYNSSKGNGSHPLYRKFINTAIRLTNKNGLVLMISPPGFLNTSDAMVPSETFDLLKGGNLTKLRLNGVNNFFPGIGSPICYIVWENTPYQGKTIIDDAEYDISEMTFITRIFNELVHSIVNKVLQKDTIHFQYRKDSDKNSFRVCFKELNHISNRVGNLVPTIVIPGEESNGDFVRHCSNEKEAESLKKYLSSRIISFFNFITRYNSVFHNRMIGRIKFVDLTRTWTDSELYEHFGLTEEEVAYIEEQVK